MRGLTFFEINVILLIRKRGPALVDDSKLVCLLTGNRSNILQDCRNGDSKPIREVGMKTINPSERSGRRP